MATGHNVHVDAAARENDPAEHAGHDGSPGELANVPAAQFVQLARETAAVGFAVPMGHCPHVVEFAGANDPAVHEVHVKEPGAEL